MREPLKDAYKEMMEEAEAERSSRSRGRRFVRSLTLLGVATAIGYLLGAGSATGDGFEMETETETQPEPDSGTEASESSGRGSLLTKLVFGGTILGVAYAFWSRQGSVDEVVDQATEQVQSVAGTEEATEKVTAVTGEAAERIQETGEEAAETIEEGTEEVADQVEETGEEVEEQAGEEEETEE